MQEIDSILNSIPRETYANAIKYIIMAAIILFCAIRGKQKGALFILYNIVSIILLCVITIVVRPSVSEFVKEETQIYNSVYESVNNNIKTDASKVSEDKSIIDFAEILSEEQYLFFSTTNERLLDFAKEIGSEAEVTRDAIVESISVHISEYIVSIIEYAISFAIAVCVVVVIRLLVYAFGKVPGIKDINQALGFVVGASEGVLIVFILSIFFRSLG